MSESMTVEQAISFTRVVREVPELKSRPGRSLEACMVLADEVERLQARVAELEAEKWNAQIAEAALLSVEKERDTLETDCDHANSQRAAAEQERDKWHEIANRWLAVSNVQARVIDALKQERDELLSRLPDGMKHCTIVFKECEKGHGWLTATNWVQHGCPTCERDELRRQNDDLILKQFDHIGSGNKAVRRIKAAAVREAAKLFPESPFVDCDNVRNDLLEYANQIEGGA